jgi:hypothetical protein
MKRVALSLMLASIGTAALAGEVVEVPEMDGGFALAAAAVAMGVGAVIYEKFIRK